MDTHTLPDGRTLQFDLRRQGNSAGPPIVFLNGLSQTTVGWSLQAQRLREVRDVLLYDAAGQGRSAPPPPGSRPEHHALDLLHLLDALGLDRVDLCGFSFGSRIALRLALAVPARVRRLALLGCAHRETALRRWIVQGWLDALDAGGMELCFQVVTPDVVGEEWLRKNDALRPNMLRAFLRRNDPASLRILLADSLLEGGDLGDELRALTHPTIICRGAQDAVVSRALNDELLGLLPNATYHEHADCGHTVAIERPDWLAERLSAHLVSR